jgi:TRAP-type C4-dicarboxylate transport system permease small subunit
MFSFFHRPARRDPFLLQSLGDLIDLAIVILATLLITVMFVNVVSRAVLNADIAWNTEFGEFVLVWVTFLGCAAAARRGLHMRITEIASLLPASVKRWTEVAAGIAVLTLLALIVWRGSLIVASTMKQQMSVLYWPVGLQYLALPVGSFLTMVFVFYETVLSWLGVSERDLENR